MKNMLEAGGHHGIEKKSSRSKLNESIDSQHKSRNGPITPINQTAD